MYVFHFCMVSVFSFLINTIDTKILRLLEVVIIWLKTTQSKDQTCDFKVGLKLSIQIIVLIGIKRAAPINILNKPNSQKSQLIWYKFQKSRQIYTCSRLKGIRSAQAWLNEWIRAQASHWMNESDTVSPSLTQWMNLALCSQSFSESRSRSGSR